jgi:hypothetical protein
MSVLQLQVDVDSDVHPELHAILASIGAGGSQAERLRQLAATGLIWEHLRLNLRPSVGPAASMPARGRGDDPDRVGPTSALPMQRSSDPGGAGASAGGAENPVDNLPILHDAVETSAVERSTRLAPKKEATVASAGAAPSESRAPNKESTRVPQRTTPARPLDEAGSATAERDVVSPPLRRMRPRARLLRMREKGLFNNGPDC